MSLKLHKLIRQAAVWVTILVICFSTVTKPFFAQPAEAAYHQTYIQTTIDVSNWNILASAVDIKVGGFTNDIKTPLELQRIGAGTLSSLASASTPSAAASYISSSPGQNETGTDSINLVMSFPGNTKSDSIFVHTASTANDTARAALVSNSLVYDLNAAFKFVYGDAHGNYTPAGETLEDKVGAYKTAMKSFLSAVPGGSCNGASFTEGTGNSPEGEDNKFITITKGEESRTFQYSMKKGYINGPANANLIQYSGYDAEYIHWGHFAVEAFINYSNEDEKLQVTPDNVYNSTPGALEKVFADMLDSLCNSIESMLGLWNFDQLIFNEGIRGTQTYAGGIFPTSWQSYIWTFFLISELAAVGILLYSIIVNIGKKALSTVNPIARASAISQIESLFFVAIALGLLPIVIQLLIDVSFNLTGMFADALGGATAQQRFAILTTGSGALGAVITRIIYLGSVIYFNFFYGIRALTVAFLIITAPIFISCVGVSEKKKMLAETWAREFAANLFIQPLQALMMAFILLLPATGRTFDAIVLAYAMIPLTHMVRGLFFGSAGSFAHQLADKGRGKTMQTLGRAGMTAGGVAVGAMVGGAHGAFDSLRKGGGSESSNGSQESGGASDPGPATRKPSPEQPCDSPGNPTEGSQNGAPADGNQAAGRAPASAPASATNSGSTRTTTPVTAGVDGGSSRTSNEVASAVRDGDAQPASTDAATNTDASPDGGAGSAPSNDSTPQKNRMRGALMTAAAVGLGAAGGGLGTFNRRVFGVSAGKDGILTQLSGGYARKANAALHPAAPKTEEAPAESSSGQAPGTNAPGSDTQSAGTPVPNATPFNRDDFNTYIPPTESYSEEHQNDHNAYDAGAATMVGSGADAHYEIPRESLGDAGVRINSPRKSDTAKVTYDFAKMSQGDVNRATEMAAILEHGTKEEIQTLHDAGIESIQLRTQKIDGQDTVTGVEMTANTDKLNQNFGIDLKPSSLGGRGMQVPTTSGGAPQLVPDVTQHLNTARSFSADIQQAGGRIDAGSSGMASVSIPTASVPQLTQKYQSLDTSTATVSGDNTVFSVPSSTLIQGDAPASPVVHTITQRRTQPITPPAPVDQPNTQGTPPTPQRNNIPNQPSRPSPNLNGESPRGPDNLAGGRR